MSRAAGHAEYARRMHAVQAHIDAHLDAALDLPSLAAVAHFSPFHFPRLFTAWMGETLGQYLWRRRLELAAMRMLAQPRLAILPVALGVGFGSAEAFSRAFKARFGASPSAWRSGWKRRESNPDQALRKLDQAASGLHRDDGLFAAIAKETLMNAHLVERQPVTIAYLRHTGPYGRPIEEFWMNEVSPWMEANRLFERPRYGISHDDPEITAPEQCRYDACVEVPADFVSLGPCFKTTLPGGRYLCARFAGTSAEIAAAWSALLREGLPESGMQLDARPCFEHYPLGSEYDPETGVFDCEICLPVVPL